MCRKWITTSIFRIGLRAGGIVVGLGLITEPCGQALAQSAPPRQARRALDGAGLVPGTGQVVARVGDDFEDPQWAYTFHNPKNSKELDGQARKPEGYSVNRRWFEGPLRGQPDVIERVEPPPEGVEGSTGALLLRSLYTGNPRRPSGSKQQDDLIVSVRSRIGGRVPVSQLPSFLVHVYLPPFEEWEPRTGNSFGLRAGTHGVRQKSESAGGEEYWPGMFIYFYSQNDRRRPAKEDSAVLRVRGGRSGQDFTALTFETTGWWTLGMSFTSDGQVHYYASPGVDPLTAEDRIASEFPYGFRCRTFETFFFNVISADDGRTWSTPWIIDDPLLFLGRPPKPAPTRAGPARPSRSGNRR